MRLTKNFSLEELTRSTTAKNLGIDNTPSDEIIVNLKMLAEKVLQPIRDYINIPIKVNSGYRCEKLNKIVGGKPNSQHLRGEAADIVPMKNDRNMSVKELFNTIKTMAENGLLVVDQCIHEVSHEVDWVHVSYTSRRPNRNMFIELKV
jgi:uncharacterized protein YcbK (DUF882 family)